MAYKQKGFPMHGTKSALKQETKKETVKAGWKKEADNMKKEVEAGKSGDVLTENIRRTARKKSYEK